MGAWNVRWFPGGKSKEVDEAGREKHIREVREKLQELDVDVMFLCEVESVAALRELVKGTEYGHVACSDIPRLGDEGEELRQQGLAVVSKYRWAEAWVLDFSSLTVTADRPSRGVLGVRFDVGGEGEVEALTCYGVHLKSNLGSQRNNRLKRERAVRYLVEDFQERGLDPRKDGMLVVGDFNTSLWNPLMKGERSLRVLLEMGFRNGYLDAPFEETITLKESDYFPAASYDYILVSEGGGLGFQEPAQTHEVGWWLSDHNPVVMRMKVGE